MLGLLHLNDRSHAGGAVSLLPQALRIASSDYTQTKDEDQNPQNIVLGLDRPPYSRGIFREASAPRKQVLQPTVGDFAIMV